MRLVRLVPLVADARPPPPPCVETVETLMKKREQQEKSYTSVEMSKHVDLIYLCIRQGVFNYSRSSDVTRRNPTRLAAPRHLPTKRPRGINIFFFFSLKNSAENNNKQNRSRRAIMRTRNIFSFAFCVHASGAPYITPTPPPPPFLYKHTNDATFFFFFLYMTCCKETKMFFPDFSPKKNKTNNNNTFVSRT